MNYKDENLVKFLLIFDKRLDRTLALDYQNDLEDFFDVSSGNVKFNGTNLFDSFGFTNFEDMDAEKVNNIEFNDVFKYRTVVSSLKGSTYELRNKIDKKDSIKLFDLIKPLYLAFLLVAYAYNRDTKDTSYNDTVGKDLEKSIDDSLDDIDSASFNASTKGLSSMNTILKGLPILINGLNETDLAYKNRNATVLLYVNNLVLYEIFLGCIKTYCTEHNISAEDALNSFLESEDFTKLRKDIRRNLLD